MRKRSFVQHPRKSVALATLAVPLSLMFSAPTFAALESNVEADYYLKLLGKYVFFDKISEPKRMACVTCHDPDTGGTGSTSGVNLHQVAITGANPHTVGNLKPPTNAYASLIPQFYPCNDGGLPGRRQQYCGGNFWSGRAEGYIHSEDASKPSGDSQYPNFSIPNFLDGVGFGFAKVPGFTGLGAVAGSSSVGGAATKHIGYEVFQGGVPDSLKRYHIYFGPTADQALNPMPNVVEQNKQRQDVCLHVKAAKYAPLYEAAWGVPIDCSNDSVSPSSDVDSETQFDISFKRIILAVCAWQASKDLDSFSSKRDKAIADEIKK
jgi:cytochrome c peroxidase